VQRGNRCCRLRGDARPPWPDGEPRPPAEAAAQPPTFVCVSALFWHCNPCKSHSPTHFEHIQSAERRSATFAGTARGFR
jgi:hypothetical protein